MTSRRAFLRGGMGLGMGLGMGAGVFGGVGPARAEAVLGDDGLYRQPWLLESFLEIESDLADARAAGKGLIVLFEQRGCPYCRELHTVNFQDARVTDYLTRHFDALQLDLWGARETVDIGGEAMEERDLARKWRVNFTPTTVFFAKDGPTEEVFRLPGYFKPFHYLSGLEYVAEGKYAEQNFQRYLQDKFAALEAQGISPDVW